MAIYLYDPMIKLFEDYKKIPDKIKELNLLENKNVEFILLLRNIFLIVLRMNNTSEEDKKEKKERIKNV